MQAVSILPCRKATPMKTIKVEEIPADAAARDFIQALDVSHEEVVFEKNGRPHAVLVSGEMLEQRRQAKERLFALIGRIQARNPDVSSDDVLDELEAMDHPERGAP